MGRSGGQKEEEEKEEDFRGWSGSHQPVRHGVGHTVGNKGKKVLRQNADEEKQVKISDKS